MLVVWSASRTRRTTPIRPPWARGGERRARLGKETVVFLSTDGVRSGGKVYVCSPCVKRRKLEEAKLVPGAQIVGAAKTIEFLSDGVPSLTY